MLPTFDFLVEIDKIYVTSQHFGKFSGTVPTKDTETVVLTLQTKTVQGDIVIFQSESRSSKFTTKTT